VPVLGNPYEFTSIMPLRSMGVFDGPGLLTRTLGPEPGERLQARLRRCINGSRFYILIRVNELSSPPERSKPAPASVALRRRVAPGKQQEYETFLKNEIAPIYRKAKAEGKIAGYSFARRSLGATAAGEVTQFLYHNNFAEIDRGSVLVQMLGPEAAAKLTAKAAGLFTDVDQVVHRRVAELSF
jgi:hypothetical protein